MMLKNYDCWKELLSFAMAKYDETLGDIQSSTLTDAEMDRKFKPSYGIVEGAPFTVWTTNRVYFPICHSGVEWVGSVSRNPDGEPTRHQGA